MLRAVIICGDRNWCDEKKIRARMKKLHAQCIIIEGDARGADRIAGAIADELGFPHVKVPANWTYYRRAAGPIRNGWMLRLKPDHVIAFHSDIENSVGTKNCIEQAKKLGIPFEVIT